MQIHFWGAANTVTGSAHYIRANGHTLLLDCGLFQGRRSETYATNRSFRFPPKDVDAVVLSHAHIDHSGNLPNLVSNGFDGPIYATESTVYLCELMLMDSAHIQESDVQYINSRREKQGRSLVEPLYTAEDAKLAISKFVKRRYEQPFEVIPGVTATFVEAGHILGSAAIILDVDENGQKNRLWFSGDIGRFGMPILKDPVLPYDADYLIMESTYGDRPHPPYQNACEELKFVLSRTLNRGGKVIIPAFAVGRTQELVYAIHKMMDAGDIPAVPVYVDSPLAVNVTDVFRRRREDFDKEAIEMVRNSPQQAALGFDRLTYIRSVEESKALNRRDDPMIIISASGMVEVGRVLHHLRHNIHDPKNTLLIVSWQAPHTLGRRLVEGAKEVKIYGEVYENRISVESIQGFSAHAGQDLLVEYAMQLKGRVKDIFLVHGEERGALPLMHILNANGLDYVHYPQRNHVFHI
ncbi:MAG: MBL fold metallo-hydrolase [Anaerolineales bacterium]|nr:MBL fold metallo-hydrolase [Anaerolineales bacterium]